MANRLHFLITDVAKDSRSLLTYTVTVASLDGVGTQARGTTLWPSLPAFGDGGLASCDFTLLNSGSSRGAEAPYDTDTYRLIVSTDARGWEVRLPNALATAKFGQHVKVTARVKLTATSISDPSKTATGTCTAFGF